jgi:hypothetical protein
MNLTLPVLRCLAMLLLMVAMMSSASAGGVRCSTSPQQAAVEIFEYLESPDFEFGSEEVYRAIFSRRLLSVSSNAAINSAIRSARGTYQDNRAETSLSHRLVAPPMLIRPDDGGFNQRAEVTVKILSLSARGKIEQRMSLTCESGFWRVDSFSYGPQEFSGKNTSRPND